MVDQFARNILLDGFRYDRFANEKWLPFVLSSESERSQSVFHHILSASTIWLTRVHGTSLPSMPTVALTVEAIHELEKGWIEAVDSNNYDREFTYRNTQGDEYTRVFGDIARHVVNHGTYHRGQLRQIHDEVGEEFPETDLMGYMFERGPLK